MVPSTYNRIVVIFASMWLAVVAIVYLAAFGLPDAFRLEPGDLATWLSALATFGAVAVALGVSLHQHRAAEIRERSLTMNKRMAAHALLSNADIILQSVTPAAESIQPPQQHDLDRLVYAENQLKTFDVAGLGSYNLSLTYSGALMVLGYARMSLQRAVELPKIHYDVRSALVDWRKDFREQIAQFAHDQFVDLMPSAALRSNLKTLQLEWKAKDTARRRAARRLARTR